MVVGVRPDPDQSSDTVNKRVAALKATPPLILTLAAGIICYGMFFNRGLGLSVIGYSIAPAERVMQGEVPYRDFLFNYTPGILWVNAALMKAFGASLMTTRIGLFAFKLLTLLTLFYVARRLTNAWCAVIPVVLTLAWPGYQQAFNVYPDQYLMLFALAGLLCLLNYDHTGRARWLVLCGVSTGAVFLLKYNVGVFLLVLGAVAVAIKELMTTGRPAIAAKGVALYTTGFAFVAAILVAYLAYNQAFGAMVGHFLHHAAEYSEARSVGLPSPGSLIPAAVVLLPPIVVGLLVLAGAGRAVEVYWIAALLFIAVVLLQATRGNVFNDSTIAWVAYFPPLIFAVATAVALWQLRHKERAADWWRNNGAITMTGLFALAVYLEVFPRADYFHLVRVLPPVFLFFFAMLARSFPALKDRLRKRVPSPFRAGLLIASTPLVLLIVIGWKNTWEPQFESGFHFRDKRELAIERGRGIFVEERQAELTEGLVQLIQANSSKDDYIFSFAQRGSAFYFLAERRNATRFLWWRSVGISSDEREAVMTMIADRRAKLIIVQDVAANKEIQDFIGANYDSIGTVTDIAVYGLRKPASDAPSNQPPVN